MTLKIQNFIRVILRPTGNIITIQLSFVIMIVFSLFCVKNIFEALANIKLHGYDVFVEISMIVSVIAFLFTVIVLMVLVKNWMNEYDRLYK